eukprot:NODE_9465_length_589_cov_37.248927_g8830_i0.p1 GENE.NODE_9465_length_589_cov_37.248927_g8830_i0~~NODE_9465_length_589_cov_37.248927_g8830_i0.p1  ORF type:complete len:170 (+),score=34.67 NODE_9465_length_589_cov_37.248927_g8830_i0:68-511(+)
MSTMIEDTFEVKELDPEGRKFDLVSRVVMRSERHELDCITDINIDVYPIELPCKLTIAWAKTIELDGRPTQDTFDKALCTGKRRSLMDLYEYVITGRVYKVDTLSQQMKEVVYISYGGLLQKIVGEPHDLKDFEMDGTVYCLMKKVV